MKKYDKKLLLIFDLDETLVHATKKEIGRLPDFQVGVYKVYKRPNFDDFIDRCHEKYRLAIWSSANDEYVKETVKTLFPSHISLEFVWTRLHCSMKIVKKPLIEGMEDGIMYKEHQWIKPLHRIKRKGVGIKTMLIIDNSPYKVIESRENALIIPSFEGDETDNELNKLYDFLANFENVKDVRKVDKAKWALK